MRAGESEVDEFTARIIAGDESAIDLFQKRFQERFEHIAYARGIPDADCEDVARSAVLVGLDQLRRGLFRGESLLATWLERIIRGRIVDYQRTARARMATAHAQDDFVKRSPVPVSADDAELKARIHQALNLLDAPERAILVLKDQMGFTSKEVAKRLNWPEARVNQLVVKARRNFRRAFGSRCNLPPITRLRIESTHE